MTSSTPGATTPSRNDDRNDTPARCPACGQPFTPSGRRRWCSAACRQAAWRRRHPAPGPAAAGLPAAPPAASKATIYQCPECDQRYIGQQYCYECATFCRRIGPGGPCPHCDEPVSIHDLTTVT
jgi:predicted amidophosphoribosyltransferase